MGGSLYFDKRAKRWVISIYWEGKRIGFSGTRPRANPSSKAVGRKTARPDPDRSRRRLFQPEGLVPRQPAGVKEYAKEWLKCLDVSPNTLKDYTGSVNNHIVPFFGDKDIRRIRYSDLVKFYSWIPREKKGKYNVMSCLRTMLRYAWKSEDIPKVPPFPSTVL